MDSLLIHGRTQEERVDLGEGAVLEEGLHPCGQGVIMSLLEGEGGPESGTGLPDRILLHGEMRVRKIIIIFYNIW